MKNKAAKAITILVSVCMITGTPVSATEFVSGTDVAEQNTEQNIEQFSDTAETAETPETYIPDESEETIDPATDTGTTRLTSTTFNVVIEPTKAVYTGEEQKPKVTLKSRRSGLADPQEGVDYQISYVGDFTNAGTYNIIISGLGKYTGSFTKTYRIETKELTGCTVTLDAESFTYNGEQKTPQVTVKDGEKILTVNKDYTVKYSNNINPSEKALVTVKGIGNYGKNSRTIGKYFTITEAARDISKCTMSISGDNNITYNGSEKKIFVTVKDAGKTLKAGTDYTVSYKDNIHAGTATAIVTGAGKYFGTLEKTFQIYPKSLPSNISITLTGEKWVYDGTEKRPLLTVKIGDILLREGIDYKVSYKNNINAGTATVTVTGMGDYKSYKSKTYTINKANISQASVVLSADSFRYDGKAKKPGVTVTVGSKQLSANTDYTVSYANNIKVGNATVTVNGKGNYTGTVKKTFKIYVPLDLEKEKGELTLSESSFVYDGTEKKPSVVLKVANKILTENKDYTVTYKDNKYVGLAAVIVTGQGDYTGSLSRGFEITPRKISAATATLTKSSYIYTGAPIEPEITMTDNTPLVRNKDYTISCSNNVNVGTAKATVTGMGNYTGSVTITFKIQKKDGQIIASNKTVNQGSKAINVADSIVTDGKVTITSSAPNIVKISGNKFIPKSPGKATLTIRAKAGKNYTAVAEQKITITVRPLNTKSFTVKAGKNKADVSWAAAKSVTGYQIQYSTDSSMENAKTTTVKGSAQNTTLKKLQSKKNCYIRIRTYKKVGGKNYYSDWSSVKKVTVK